jgi:hypothetical protein
VIHVEIVVARTLDPGVIEQAVLLVAEESAAELASPEDMTFLDLMGLAGAEIAELAYRFPVFGACRPNQRKSQRYG